MNSIANADDAIVDIRKLRDYCLNREHPRGRHKARVFLASLGLTREHSGYLRAQLIDAVRSGLAVEINSDIHGRRYRVDFTLDTGRRAARVRSLWIVRCDENFPRFTSCYVL